MLLCLLTSVDVCACVLVHSLPGSEAVSEHTDVDLLVSDYFLAKRLLDGDSGYPSGAGAGAGMVEDGGDRVMNLVTVGESDTCFSVI